MSFLHRMFFFAVVFFSTTATAMNLTKPYNVFFKPTVHKGDRWILSMLAETGIGHAKAFDDCGTTNPLRIWNRNQDAIAMLNGFPESSPQGQLLDILEGAEIAPIDNNIRGHFLVCGDLKLNYSLGFGARYFLPLDFSIAAYLPAYSMTLKNVSWSDLTPAGTPGDPDARVKNYLTNNFFSNVFTLGDGLQLGGWHRAGIGDLLIMAEWLRDFPQSREMLKNVRLNPRLGISFPTGKKSDQDKIFAPAFGTDGAYGAYFGGELIVTLGSYFRCGFTVDLLHAFGNMRNWRIKTDPSQTDLLLLEKTCVFIDWGLQQQFDLFIEFFNMRGFFLRTDYQFTKHGENIVIPQCNQFLSNIANTAEYREDWTAHEILTKLGYDFGYRRDDSRVRPTLSLYAQVPVNGKRSVLFTTIGAILSFEF